MALVLPPLLNPTMAQNNSTNNATDDVKPTVFHDFLGPVAKCAAASDGAGGSSSVSGGGRGGGPISTTSDLGSERQVGTHLEGVPFYGQKADFPGSNLGHRYAGSKRGNPDSVLMGPSRETAAQIRPEFPESSHLMKMLRNIGAERPRRPHDDDGFSGGVHPVRPMSILHTAAGGGKTDTSGSKWERAIPVNVGPVLPYPPRAGQVVPYGYQALPNRSNVGPTVVAQPAADEGSRTGIKGSGILSSVNVGGGVAEPSGGKQKSAISNPEPGRQASASASRQMTIFYGGQAHVFDDVHPNKADVIMALAGSNGGSWSTSFLPGPASKPSAGETFPAAREAFPAGRENDAGHVGKPSLPSRDVHGRLHVAGNSGHNDRMSMLPGSQGGILMKDTRGSMQATVEPNAEEKG